MLLTKKVSDLIYVMYRHGLVHTHMPKVIEINGQIVGWEIRLRDRGNHLQIRNNNLVISVQSLFEDLCAAIDLYINDFDDVNKRDKLLRNFKRGFLKMSKVFRQEEMEKRCRKGIQYIKEIIKASI